MRPSPSVYGYLISLFPFVSAVLISSHEGAHHTKKGEKPLSNG
jgi:hypothetical protein